MEVISEAQAREARSIRNVWYRAYPTRRDYSFTFELEGAGWRIYANNPPSVHGFLHLLPGTAHRMYICYDRPGSGGHAVPVPTLSEAQSVAALWADCVENFRTTGQFTPAAGRPQVVDRSVINGFAPYPSA